MELGVVSSGGDFTDQRRVVIVQSPAGTGILDDTSLQFDMVKHCLCIHTLLEFGFFCAFDNYSEL